MPDPRTSPSLEQVAFSGVTGRSVPPRCTRKERCERSREPRRFASEMKQCVRLTVHPSNISVSQYNVLVRAVGSGPRDMTTLSPPKPPSAPLEKWATPDQHSCSRAALNNVSLEVEEGSMHRTIGAEALCIMGRKTSKYVIPKMTERVTERGRVLGTLFLSVRWEGCMCRGRKGQDGSHVHALGTWWLVCHFSKHGDNGRGA